MSTLHPLIESDRVEGTEVFDAAGVRLGVVRRMLIDREGGRVVYVLVAFTGVAGARRENFLLPWSRLRYDRALGGYRSDVDERELSDAPAHARGDAVDLPTEEEEAELSAYFRIPPHSRSF